MGSSREPPDRFHNDNSPGIKSSPSSSWKVAGLHHDESYCELGKREMKTGQVKYATKHTVPNEIQPFS